MLIRTCADVLVSSKVSVKPRVTLYANAVNFKLTFSPLTGCVLLGVQKQWGVKAQLAPSSTDIDCFLPLRS